MLRPQVALVVLLLVTLSLATFADDQKPAPAGPKIPSGAKVYVATMPDGFDTYVKAALVKKKVPVQVVESRDQAEYEMTGTSESKKAGAAKILITGSWHSNEEASIRIVNLKSGEIAWAYSANKQDSAHGKQSTAEACAKHLKETIEGK